MSYDEKSRQATTSGNGAATLEPSQSSYRSPDGPERCTVSGDGSLHAGEDDLNVEQDSLKIKSPSSKQRSRSPSNKIAYASSHKRVSLPFSVGWTRFRILTRRVSRRPWNGSIILQHYSKNTQIGKLVLHYSRESVLMCLNFIYHLSRSIHLRSCSLITHLNSFLVPSSYWQTGIRTRPTTRSLHGSFRLNYLMVIWISIDGRRNISGLNFNKRMWIISYPSCVSSNWSDFRLNPDRPTLTASHRHLE